MRADFFANAKINLYLDITGRRSDGYHLLETVMQSIDVCDRVSVELNNSGAINVSASNPAIPENEGNICYKAAKLLREKIGENFGADIHIEKHIPFGAGLGGGSADAAAVLEGLNYLLQNPLSEKELLLLSAEIGADVPFCLTGGTKLCKGIGEEFFDIEPFPEKTYLIVMPNYGCDTKIAYRKYDSSPVAEKNALDEFLGSGEKFPEELYNVFQVLYEDERINRIAEKLKKSGAEGACLSGSGAAVFGVFDNEQQAMSAAEQFPDYFTAVSRPAAAGVERV